MHYINIIDLHNPDEFFMFMSHRINPLNIQRNNLWTMCKINDYELSVCALSDIVSDYIWENILPRYCMIFLKDYNLNTEIKKDIVIRSMHIAYCLRFSQDILSEKIKEYIENDNSNKLCLEGFVKFRMKGLLDDIKTLIEISVYENSMEDELSNFIDFMKSIISEQSSIYDVIYLIEESEGFKIINDTGEDITTYCIEHYVGNKLKINYPESIISSIVFIAPQKIFLHCSDETFCSAFCELIKGIFSGRVVKY